MRDKDGSTGALHCVAWGKMLCCGVWKKSGIESAHLDDQTHRNWVFLIGLELKSGSSWETRESLEELAELAGTAGAEVMGTGVQKLEAPVAGTFIGTGKAAEYAAFCRKNDVDTAVFDDELTPAQSRNLEKVFGCKILDRTALILDIFAQRARTREGKLQVELAQLQHFCCPG